MKIAWVSSWPPRHCGIATYSEELVSTLRGLGNDVKVICHTDGGEKGEKDVYPVLDPSDSSFDETLYQVVKKIHPEVVHIQHEYGLYVRGNNDYSSGLLRPLFRWHAEAEFPVVITYHSVYTALDRGQRYFMDISLNLVNAGIVHQENQWASIPLNIGRVPHNVYVIPHGAKGFAPISGAKEKFGLKDKMVVGMIGWWEPNKGIERMIKLWPEIISEAGREDLVLVVAGDARPGSPGGQITKPKVLDLLKKSPVRKRIKVIRGSFNPQRYDEILSSFDLMVLPYSFASQSGNLAHAFAMGIPAVVTAVEGLKSQVEESKAGIAVPPEDDLELKRAILTLIGNEELRRRYKERAKNYVTDEIRWSIIANKHQRIYQFAREEMTKGIHHRLDPRVYLE